MSAPSLSFVPASLTGTKALAPPLSGRGEPRVSPVPSNSTLTGTKSLAPPLSGKPLSGTP